MTLNNLYTVDLIAGEICENLGRLFNLGVLDTKKSVELLKTINDAHVDWMQKHYTADEIEVFMVVTNKLTNK